MKIQTEAESWSETLDLKAKEILDLQVKYFRGEASENDLNEMLSNVTRILHNTVIVLKRV